MEKVSIIIPTYNRFKYLLNTIKSVKEQTYSDIEIIVVNDASTQPEYYSHDWSGVTIIHLPINTRSMFGYPCASYVRNTGTAIATGKYVAFCDDDDIWFPHKLELQIAAMKASGCKMSSTDGLIGHGPYDSSKQYKLYNGEHYYNMIRDIYKDRGSDLLADGFPHIWTYELLLINNCIICSSVVIEKEVFDKIKGFNIMPPPGEDYECWMRALLHTNSVYVTGKCLYYDAGHGDGQHY